MLAAESVETLATDLRTLGLVDTSAIGLTTTGVLAVDATGALTSGLAAGFAVTATFFAGADAAFFATGLAGNFAAALVVGFAAGLAAGLPIFFEAVLLTGLALVDLVTVFAAEDLAAGRATTVLAAEVFGLAADLASLDFALFADVAMFPLSGKISRSRRSTMTSSANYSILIPAEADLRWLNWAMRKRCQSATASR